MMQPDFWLFISELFKDNEDLSNIAHVASGIYKQCTGSNQNIVDVLSLCRQELAEEESKLSNMLEVHQHAITKLKNELSIAESHYTILGKKHKDVKSNKSIIENVLKCVSGIECSRKSKQLSDDQIENSDKLSFIVWLLKQPTLTNESLTSGLLKFEEFCSTLIKTPWDTQVKSWLEVVSLLTGRLGKDLPPDQAIEWRILSSIVKRANYTNEISITNVFSTEIGFNRMKTGLQSINDDLKASICQCICDMSPSDNAKDLICTSGAYVELLKLLTPQTADNVVKAALTALYLTSQHETCKLIIRSKQVINSVLRLIQFDNDSYIENAILSISYLTLDKGNMESLRESNGIEAIVSTLFHPLPNVKCHAAGALWHIAANEGENRDIIREKGGIAALCSLLHVDHSNVVENAAGALWNLSVDESNTKMIYSLGGFKQLIHLLNSPQPGVVINSFGTVNKCCELYNKCRAAVRQYDAVPLLLKLLQSSNSQIVYHSATVIRHCSRNDNFKIALIGEGLKTVLSVLDKHSSIEICEDLLQCVLICSIKDDMKMEIYNAGAIKVLIKLLNNQLSYIREKAMGTLRNLSTIPVIREQLVSENIVHLLIGILSKDDREVLSQEMKELTISTVWNLCWSDTVRQNAVQTNLLPCLVMYLNMEHGEGMAEFAAGAIHTLCMNSHNRNLVREYSTLNKLIKLLACENEYILENSILAIKTICTQNTQNQKQARDLGLIPILVDLLKSESERVLRESCLCLKLVANTEESKLQAEKCGVFAELTRLKGNMSLHENVRKVASVSHQYFDPEAEKKVIDTLG